MNSQVTQYIQEIRSAFHQHRDEKNALAMKAYMRNQYLFFGIKRPERDIIQKEIFAVLPVFEMNELDQFIKLCWEQPEREFQLFAMDYLVRIKKHWSSSILNLFEWMITQKSWWDTVDTISTKMIGVYFLKYPEYKISKSTEWNASDNIWLIRVSILFQLKYKDKLDIELLFNYILPHTKSTEFFIQKVIGWTLRELSKTHPSKVLDFLTNNKVMPLSKREALKYLQK